ncbi:MAG: FeoA family protein [Limisphaerales bacterium]
MKAFAQITQCDDRNSSDGDRQCRKPFTCQLSRVKAGMSVRIKELSAPPNVTQRLREIGFGEQQVIRLLVRQSNLICLVCNARLALSSRLAQMIIVEPLTV